MTYREVRSEIAGAVWQVLTAPGRRVREGDEMLILESMKMEVPVAATCNGTVADVLVATGYAVVEDDLLVIIAAD